MTTRPTTVSGGGSLSFAISGKTVINIFKEGEMRLYQAPRLAAVLASLLAVSAHAHAYGGEWIDNDSGVPGSVRPSAVAFGASDMNVMHRQQCALTPSQRLAAENLAAVLVKRARAAWIAVEHEATAGREARVEQTLVRTLERDNECPIIAHRAVALARNTFAREDPGNQAFDLTLTALDVGDKTRSCDCLPPASSGPAFGGPPLGDSGGGGGGVTHPPVASPQ